MELVWLQPCRDSKAGHVKYMMCLIGARVHRDKAVNQHAGSEDVCWQIKYAMMAMFLCCHKVISGLIFTDCAVRSIPFETLKTSIVMTAAPAKLAHTRSVVTCELIHLIHSHKCNAFPSVILPCQLSKFKSFEIFPTVSLKKFKFYMPCWFKCNQTGDGCACTTKGRTVMCQVNTVCVHKNHRGKFK